ncbi:phosphonate ABC transporter ATP-binding protein [Salibacterium salarium]|uniref:Phosphonate ABC transporter ATP-binding protein n=1 Tax=Salibacterium salarium TaxID=284579 RepID=A0A3R9PLN7_9BACI|nr:phosphonate ABC transporter ATP-binding protein [Salibacterium salarium]RSL33585.1 phosphonate ABC transporter ATP-binding protein [Salibacterium salarium]
MSMILNVENLVKQYSDGTLALNGINIKINQGEFVAVIGPSGAGKSTLLRCINRLVNSTGGSINFMGNKVEDANKPVLRNIRANIGMIFQHYNLVERASVLENVLHGRLGYMNSLSGMFNRYPEVDKKNAIKWLEKLGLENEMYKRADELSGGQKQRVGVCRALTQDPNLILADEPIASLDPNSSNIVMESIYNNCKEMNIACLVNLHQVEIAQKYATRIIGIKGGEVIFDGDVNQLDESIIHDIYKGKEEEIYKELTV